MSKCVPYTTYSLSSAKMEFSGDGLIITTCVYGKDWVRSLQAVNEYLPLVVQPSEIDSDVGYCYMVQGHSYMLIQNPQSNKPCLYGTVF